MRMRERPWTSTVARMVPVDSHSPPQESEDAVCSNISRQNLQRQHLKSRQHCQQFQPCSYTRCSGIIHQGDDLEVSLFKDIKSNYTTFVQTGKLPYFKTISNNHTSETHVLCNSYLLNQDPDSGTISPLFKRQVFHHTAQLKHPASVMTRNIASLRSKSAFRTRTNSEVLRCAAPNNTRRRLNSCTGHRSFTNSRTNLCSTNVINRRTNTKDTVQNGTRNNYRNVDESIFKLSSDNLKPDASSGVTFNVTDDERTSQFPVVAAVNGSMSSPDLPPITHRGDKRKISSNSVTFTGNKPVVKQLAPPVSKKTSYSRRSSTETAGSSADASVNMVGERQNQKRFPLSRNQSDSSQKNLQANGSNHSKGSTSSAITSCIASQTTESRVNGGHSGSDAKKAPVKDIKYLNSGHRAHSLCATDPTDSQGRLETLIEGQSSGTIKSTHNSTKSNSLHTSNNNNRGIPMNTSKSKNVISNVIYNSARTTNNNGMYDTPSISRPATSMPVSGSKIREGSSKYLKMSNRSSQKEILDDTKIDTVDAFRAKGRMVRSNSENKLNGQSLLNSNEHKLHSVRYEKPSALHSISKNLPLDKIERQNSQQRSRCVTSRSNQGGTFKLRRYNSVSNVYNENTRDQFSDTQDEDDLYYTEENSEASSRLVAWLYVVNNIDKYDIDPKNETYVEYSDDPPQTDTAIHLVYDG